MGITLNFSQHAVIGLVKLGTDGLNDLANHGGLCLLNIGGFIGDFKRQDEVKEDPLVFELRLGILLVVHQNVEDLFDSLLELPRLS